MELIPDGNLHPTPQGWIATEVKVRFHREGEFPAGWYRFSIALASADRFTTRKRADLVLEDAAGRTISQDSVSWNRELNDSFLVHLPQTAIRLTLTLTQAEGEFALTVFEFRRLPATAVALAALREKLRLLSAFGCFKPVLKRGFGMLIRGRFAGIARKLKQGLLDGRAMRLGGYRAQSTAGHWMKSLALKADEADAAWWRRHAISAAETAHIRAECDALPDAPPLAVLIPVQAHRLEFARLAALAVRRQFYPHWELLLACAGPSRLQSQMASWLGADPRVRVSLVDADIGLPVAMARAIQQTDCERVLVLPDEAELREDALFQLAKQVIAEPIPSAILAPLAGGGEIALIKTSRLGDSPPTNTDAAALCRWACEGTSPDERTCLANPLAQRLAERPLADRSRVGQTLGVERDRIELAADLLGLSGWDHLVYAILTGMPGLGVQFVKSPQAQIRPDLLPPQFQPSESPTDAAMARLIVAPPFLVERFDPDERTTILTMWETDALRPADVQTLNQARQILVPSQWNAECFRRSGVTVPIRLVPLGFDPLIYHSDESEPEVVTFGTAGALAAGGLRKNAQRVIDLFREAFPLESDVRLRVKITPTSPHLDTRDDPRIDVLRAALPHKELAAWYRSLTVYVNGSFGEGFGLHLIEAMACGRPLISSQATGLTTFFDGEVGYAVPHRLVPVHNDIYTGHWAEPSESAIVSQMRRVYENPAEARVLGARSATRARNFTWKAAGRQLRMALKG